jgi:competence protein ComEA
MFQADPSPVPFHSEESFLKSSIRVSAKINVNRATTQELETLPGIGQNLAQTIIQYRDMHGDFQTLEQLKRVKGIGEKRFTTISEFLTLDEGLETFQQNR